MSPWWIIQCVYLIVSQSRTTLSHRKPASTGISHDICRAYMSAVCTSSELHVQWLYQQFILFPCSVRHLLCFMVRMLQSDTQINTCYRTSLLTFVRYLNEWCDNLKSPRNQVVSDVIIRKILDSPCGGFENCWFMWCDTVQSDVCVPTSQTNLLPPIRQQIHAEISADFYQISRYTPRKPALCLLTGLHEGRCVMWHIISQRLGYVVSRNDARYDAG